MFNFNVFCILCYYLLHCNVGFCFSISYRLGKMEDSYSYSHYSSPQRQSQYGPKFCSSYGCAQAARNIAQYHDITRLNEGFRNRQRSDSLTSQMAPSPQDPYANLYGYHHFHHEYCSMNRLPMNYPHMRHVYQHTTRDPVAFDGDRLPSYNPGQVQAYIPQNDKVSFNFLSIIFLSNINRVISCDTSLVII